MPHRKYGRAAVQAKQGRWNLRASKACFLISDFDSMDIDFKNFEKILYILPMAVEEKVFEKGRVESSR